MPRRFLLPLVFAAAALGFVLASARPVPAQAAGTPTDESFDSADGVTLNGRFYKAVGSKTNSCVLLLPGYKKDPTKGDWDGLAKELATKQGFHVLLLHYRGHGKSKDVAGKEFYGHPVLGKLNANLVPGYNKNPIRSTLEMADLKPAYFPMLVNDVMAARAHLERKNDTGEVNVSSLYLIGAGDAVNLGLMYIAAEWHRETQVPNIAVPPQFVSGARGLFPGSTPAGKDIAAAIWLSPEKHSSIPDREIKALVSRYAAAGGADLRGETRMLFLHAEKDPEQKRRATYFFDEVLVAKGKGNVPKMEQTFLQAVKNSKQLSGVELLGKNDSFGTEDTIVKYLKAVEEDRKGKARVERKYAKPLPIALTTFGITP